MVYSKLESDDNELNSTKDPDGKKIKIKYEIIRGCLQPLFYYQSSTHTPFKTKQALPARHRTKPPLLFEQLNRSPII